MIDFRAPAFAMGKDRYSDIFDLAEKKGFRAEDCDRIAFCMPETWDGMDGLNAGMMRYLGSMAGLVGLSDHGKEVAQRLLDGSADA